MALNTNQNIKNQSVKTGEVLALQGQTSKALFIVHSGTVDIFSSAENVDNTAEADIIASSYYIGSIKGESIAGQFCILLDEPMFLSYRASADCTVSVYPFSRNSITKLPGVNASLAVYILRKAQGQINDTLSLLKKINAFVSLLQKLGDNLGILSGKMNERHNTGSALSGDAKELYSLFIDNNGQIPLTVDTDFLLRDHSELLGKTYGLTELMSSDIIDMNTLDFFRRLENGLGGGIKTLLQKEPPVFLYILKRYSQYMRNIVSELNGALRLLNDEWRQLLGPESSWFDEVLKSEKSAIKSLGFTADGFLSGCDKLMRKLENQYRNMFHRDAETIRETFMELMPKVEDALAGGGEEEVEIDVQTQEAIDSLSGAYMAITQFAGWPEEKTGELRDLLDNFKQLEDPKRSDQDTRKLRRTITGLYWELYAAVFLKTSEDPYPPLPIKLLLRFGFLDETMLSQKQLAFLVHSAADDTTDDNISYIDEWLEKIRGGDKYPSISEMDQTFDQMKKEQERNAGRKKKKKSQPADELDDLLGLDSEGDGLDSQEGQEKVKFEIEQMITSTTRVCSESIPAAFPVLNSAYVPEDMSLSLVTKKRLREKLDKILSIDYSLFHREVIFSGLGRPEMVMKAVLPDIVIVPSAGINIMMWQDLSHVVNEKGNVIRRKNTPARFAVPHILMADLEKVFFQACARFRWELCRSMYESLWMDPVEGGLSGQYYDYLTCYKKNPDISPEAKAEVAQQLRNFRKQHREVFADDYLKWTKYEKEGIAKLNKAVRKIFYRMIPFTKEIRENLSKLPVYSDDDYRFGNIRTKKLRELEVRYRKFEQDGVLPEELQENVDFYSA